jgi:hypothetical protein
MTETKPTYTATPHGSTLPQLPGALVERIRQELDSSEQHQFEAGWLLVEAVDESSQYLKPSQVFQAVAAKVGAAIATLRDRENMGRFYARRDVREFDMLTYGQLRACKAAGADGWRDVATWAITSADDYGGNPAPADVIRRHIVGNGLEAEPLWMRRRNRAIAILTALANDPETPPDVAGWAKECVKNANL